MTDQSAHRWIKGIADQDPVSGRYLVKEKRLGTTRRGEPFLSLVLADCTGEIEAKVWDNAEEISANISEGGVAEIQGLAGSYRGKIQLTLSGAAGFDGDFDPALLLESSPFDPGEMFRSLRDILRTMENPHLKALADRFLLDKGFAAEFKRAPAAKNFHHGYIGGLLEHTLGVCRLASAVSVLYPQLDSDLLLFGAFIHDIGKMRELRYRPTMDYTDEGRLVGHLVLGVQMVEEKIRTLRDFPPGLELKIRHLILSHHGEYEFGSPKRPKFLEAFALNLVDDLDAKINGIGRFLERDRQEGSWTDFNRLFSRYLLKGLSASDKTAGEEPRPTPQGTLFTHHL